MCELTYSDLKIMRESYELECKAASRGLPRSLWQSYSSFANSGGGIILLGIEETEDGFQPVDIQTSKLLKEFWDLANDPNKINPNILREEDVRILSVEGHPVIEIRIPRASRNLRPVYVNGNPITGTYRRNYEDDYKCSEREVRSMLADQSSSTQDQKILGQFELDDLHQDSVESYRARLSARTPHHPFLGQPLREFLYSIGAWGESRQTKAEGPTAAGLLMFGKERAILDEFPTYFLDYREYLNVEDSASRWSHRIVSGDGMWSGNLYEFYFKVIPRLTGDLQLPFQTFDLLRQLDSNVHVALREALANTLIHTDYYGERGVVVEKHHTYFSFSNPGSMRVSVTEALRGGVSDPRNALLFKMFAMIGIGERAGSGIPTILSAWNEQHWRNPQLAEETQPERTVLVLRTVSLLDEDSIAYFQQLLGDQYEELDQHAAFTLVTALQEHSVTNARLQQLLNLGSKEINRVFTELVAKGYLVVEGRARWTRYILSDWLQTQHNGVETQHNGVETQHNGVETQHNGVETQHNGVETQHNDEHRLQEIAESINGRKRIHPAKLEMIIIELCAIRPHSATELAAILQRKPETVQNHYLRKLIAEQKLAEFRKESSQTKLYVAAQTFPNEGARLQ